MQFALIGDHPHGLEMVAALLAEGHHRLAAYAGPEKGRAELGQCGLTFRAFSDLEELLALADVELVIVADDLEHRPAVLRRALQADKHVLCVHPVDTSPDICYEAAMIQQDTRKMLLPLLPERLHPGITRLAEVCRGGLLSAIQVIEAECAGTAASWDGHALLTAWDLLRHLHGEIREVSALTAAQNGLRPEDRVTLTGRYTDGPLLHLLITPGTERQLVRIRGDGGTGELVMPQGTDGPATLRIASANGEKVETWNSWDRWREMVPILEGCLDRRPQPLSWLDETRCLELFEATRTSLRRRRVVPLDYEAASEEANFKSTMTAVGCSLLMVLLLLFFAMPLVPGLKYVFLPLLVVFLAIQLLRWVVPDRQEDKPRPKSTRENGET